MVYNAENQLTSTGDTLEYDKNGNLTYDNNQEAYTYDAWNRLVTTPDKTFRYDGLGRRIVWGGYDTEPTKHLYYSAQWQVVEERLSVSGSAHAQYVWNPAYLDAPLVRDRDANSNTSDGLEERLYALHDANFNVTALIDTAGAVQERFLYDPYGYPRAYNASWTEQLNGRSAKDWNYLHQGGRFDWGNDLYHFRHRDYAPMLGRWMQQDPIGYVDGGNLYGYVGNNPVAAVDPLGLQAASKPSWGPGTEAGSTQGCADCSSGTAPHQKRDDKDATTAGGMTGCDDWAFNWYTDPMATIVGWADQQKLFQPGEINMDDGFSGKWLDKGSTRLHDILDAYFTAKPEKGYTLNNCDDCCKKGFHKVAALSYQPERKGGANYGNRDYHFLHQHCNGAWTHKMGANKVAHADFWKWANGGDLPTGADNGSSTFNGCFCIQGDARNNP